MNVLIFRYTLGMGLYTSSQCPPESEVPRETLDQCFLSLLILAIVINIEYSDSVNTPITFDFAPNHI